MLWLFRATEKVSQQRSLFIFLFILETVDQMLWQFSFIKTFLQFSSWKIFFVVFRFIFPLNLSCLLFVEFIFLKFENRNEIFLGLLGNRHLEDNKF
jgi:hypothetical protein